MMIQDEYSLFKQRLEAKFISLGFQEKIAKAISSFIKIVGKEEGLIYAECHNLFYKDTIIKGKMNDIRDVVHEIWGMETDITIGDPPAPLKKKSKKEAMPTVFLRGDRPAQKTDLITDMNFQTFVIGQSNLVAFSACEAIAKCPGYRSNPVFIYGSTGLGKTHLLHSVGNAIQKVHPEWVIVYVTSGDFMNELISSIRFNKQDQFRQKFRTCDVLLIDDIQFLENKDTTQVEFFHTFNELYLKNKQIVITSDKYPKDIPNIEERLKSRFLQGLIADVEAPSFEDRVAIITAKAKWLNLHLSQELIFHLSHHIKSNIREIQGILNNLLMVQSMSGENITKDHVEKLLKRVIRQPKTQSSGALDTFSIQKIVAQYFDVKISDIMASGRLSKHVIPRQVAMFFCRELLDNTVAEIAQAFGKKDHTTVIHGSQRILKLSRESSEMRDALIQIRKKLEI